jgi:hypothetical protein
MPWSRVCGFNNGQIILLTAPDSTQVMERAAVQGLGDGALSVLFDPEDKYQDHGAFVVFGACPPTVTVYAEDGEPAEAVLQPAMAVAEAISAKLP